VVRGKCLLKRGRNVGVGVIRIPDRSTAEGRERRYDGFISSSSKLLGDRSTRTTGRLGGRRRLSRGQCTTHFGILLEKAFDVVTIREATRVVTIREATRVRGRHTVLTGSVVRPAVLIGALAQAFLGAAIIVRPGCAPVHGRSWARAVVRRPVLVGCSKGSIGISRRLHNRVSKSAKLRERISEQGRIMVVRWLGRKKCRRLERFLQNRREVDKNGRRTDTFTAFNAIRKGSDRAEEMAAKIFRQIDGRASKTIQGLNNKSVIQLVQKFERILESLVYVRIDVDLT
jgi:hypothetical protein